MNLFDVILAEKLNGGGGGSLEKVVFNANSWSELPALNNASEYFPLNINPDANYVLGTLGFTFSSIPVNIPINANANIISGGRIAGTSGVGSTIYLEYDSEAEEWSVTKAWTNLMGSWTDITSAVQFGASNIELTLYK